MTTKLSDEEKIEIVKKYNTGKYNCPSLAKEYNLSASSIYRLLKFRGVNIKNTSECQRKYKLNENYFDIINTEDKAYFLGLLYADGYNDEKKHSISLELQEEDKDILDKFNKSIESNRPLFYRNISNRRPKSKNTYILNISNIYISKQLSKLGCVQKKSLILKFPTEEQVPNYLINHFIRGVWDGDGCITYSFSKKNTEYKKYDCRLVSTLDFCNSLKNIISSLDINSSIYRKNNLDTTTRNLSISGNKQVEKFLDWLYKDATIYLDRKYTLYLEQRK